MSERDSNHDSHQQASPVFVTTQWTRVLSAKGQSKDAAAALGELCETYYQPVVTFLRCTGNDDDRARDLAHEFFAHLLEKQNLGNVDPSCGRFRSYLLAAVKNFAVDQHAKQHAAKRGGTSEHQPLKPETDTSPAIDPPDPSTLSPEREFDRQWAMTLLDQAMNKLAREQKRSNKTEQFETLSGWLTGEGTGMPQKEAAEKLGMTEGAVKVAIHRLRKQFRHHVKQAIATTLSDNDRVDDEMNDLLSALM